MDIQQMLGMAGGGAPGGMGGPPGMGGGGQNMQQLMPFLLMLLQQLLGEGGQMPPRPQPTQGGMPFASALGAGQGGPQAPPMMPGR